MPCLEQATEGFDLYINANKIKLMGFKHEEVISNSSGKSLNISSTESDANIHIGKTWTVLQSSCTVLVSWWRDGFLGNKGSVPNGGDRLKYQMTGAGWWHRIFNTSLVKEQFWLIIIWSVYLYLFCRLRNGNFCAPREAFRLDIY